MFDFAAFHARCSSQCNPKGIYVSLPRNNPRSFVLLGNRVHHYTMHIRLTGDSGRGCHCVSMKGHLSFWVHLDTDCWPVQGLQCTTSHPTTAGIGASRTSFLPTSFCLYINSWKTAWKYFSLYLILLTLIMRQGVIMCDYMKTRYVTVYPCAV